MKQLYGVIAHFKKDKQSKRDFVYYVENKEEAIEKFNQDLFQRNQLEIEKVLPVDIQNTVIRRYYRDRHGLCVPMDGVDQYPISIVPNYYDTEDFVLTAKSAISFYENQLAANRFPTSSTLRYPCGIHYFPNWFAFMWLFKRHTFIRPSEVHIIDPNMPEWGNGKAWLYFRLDENNEFSPWTNKDYEYKEVYTEKLKQSILGQLSVILEDDEEVFNDEMLEKN
jgi:hypothetical protein